VIGMFFYRHQYCYCYDY